MPEKQHLFVYGTLAPGRSNAHVLEPIEGEWQPASVRGHLHPQGWGATQGYPAIRLDDNGPEVEGFLFSSGELEAHWPRLDHFEGKEYLRVLTSVNCGNNTVVQAYLYQLHPQLQSE